MDYRNAIKNFSFFLQSNIEGDKREAEVRFFKGRSHEELGELEEAVIEYRGTIRIDKTKKWAREANRRILMLGEFYDYKKKMTEEAEKQLAAYQDGNFLSRIDRFKGMMSESSIRDELLQKQEVTPADKGVEDGEVMDLINMIGDLDLTGEKEREKEIEKFHRDLIARGIKSEEEIRELTRKRALTFNPFRRPSVLKQTINENVNQLRYIYNKKLRAGVKLSGKIFVEMKIESNGKISSTEIISSNIGDKSFEEEIVAKISKWQFKPVSDSLGVLKIRYPFEFYEEE